MGRAPAAALPSDASIEEPASNRPTNSSSSGGKGGQGGKGGKGGRGSKGGKGAAAKGAHTMGAKAKGGGYKDGERKGKRERAGERSKGEHGKGGKRGKGGKEQAWSAPSTADMSRGGLGLGLGFERRPRRVVTKESLLVWLATRAAAGSRRFDCL